MGEWIAFGCKIKTWVFSKHVHEVFLKFHLMTGILKSFLKCLFWISKENSYFQNGVNGAFLRPKSSFLNFIQIPLFRFFWNHTWREAFKSDLKWLFWIFKENSYFAKNGVNGSFLYPKSTLLNQCIMFFCNASRW